MEIPASIGLKMTQQEQRRVGRLVGHIKSVADFLSDAVEGFKDTDFPAAIARALPWAEVVGESVAEALPPVKFVVKLFKTLTKETDPEALGHLACTIAYEHAVEQAIKEVGDPENAKQANRAVKAQLASFEPCEEVDLGVFSLSHALEHEFVRRADRLLQEATSAVGYTKAQINQLKNEVHDRFVPSLKALLSDGGTKEQFTPFTQYIELGTQERQAYKALSQHAQSQRWLFEEAPVFGREPFALKHIYVETECGKLTWGEINKSSPVSEWKRASETERMDPFSERWGSRHSLVETVIDLIGDPNFRDAIIVQGVAGAGKSSFTLRLCVELLKHGLRPIRIRLKDLRLDQHVSEALPKAVLLSVEEQLSGGGAARPENLFLDGTIFNQETTFRQVRLCRYVLILDGWDEISLSTAEGFKMRVDKMLDQIRSEYLSTRPLPVRVILTGRPSSEVNNSAFLREKTPILTIRTLRPDHLKKFVRDLTQAVKEQPICVKDGDIWTVPDLENFASVFTKYEEGFAATMPDPKRPGQDAARATEGAPDSLAVLGLPLLAHLAIRLISEWKGRPEQLVENPTTLYRSLVDLTCRKGGKAEVDTIEVERQYRILGSELRRLLQKTAAAMTVCGEESISYRELSLRLGDEEEELDRKSTAATEEHVLSSLMISFYFKGGHTHLGCEFAHKSFREYLFAEAIVEALKKYGRDQTRVLEERASYWKDFDEYDHRYEFSRALAELLAPQWLSPEVVAHLEQLVPWEIARANEGQATKEVGTPTEPLNMEGWKRVRDGLADLWDWWAEGVHLRPQPAREGKRRELVFHGPYVSELIQHSAPLDTGQGTTLPEPVRTTTMDAHLGEGLFCLCAIVHFCIAVTEWPTPDELWKGVSPIGEGTRRYQSILKQGDSEWVLFAPSGKESGYFANYICRINSAGWRPRGDFPGFTNLSGINLREVMLNRASLSRANLYRARLDRAILNRAILNRAILDGAILNKAILDGARLNGASLSGVSLSGASLNGASLLNTSGLTWEQVDLASIDDETKLPPEFEQQKRDRAEQVEAATKTESK
jgi:hypothetical protein